MSFWFNLNVFKGILWQHSQSRTAYLRQWKKRLRIRQVNGQDCSALERTASTTWELQTAIDQDQRRAPLCATWSLFPFISAPPYFSLTPCFQNNLSPASQSISHHSVMSSQKAQVGHICTLSLCLLLNVVYLFFKKLEFILPVKPSQSWKKKRFFSVASRWSQDFSDAYEYLFHNTLQQLLLFSCVYVQWFGDHIL